MTDGRDRIPAPRSLEQLPLLDRVDYADCFAARTTAQHTADEWLTLMFEHAHPAVLALVRSAHARVGRMHLADHGPENPLGWTILDRTAARIVLGVEGGIVTPRVIAAVEPDRLVVTTVLRYENAWARAVWSVGRYVHRAVARYLLATAVRHG